jgi:glutamate dehydrogenase/leucine dehydrogenase
MQWMLDEYEKQKGVKEPGAFTGKAVERGGSLGREQATGFGGFIALEKLLDKLYPDKHSRMSVAIQGFGNVGFFFAKAVHEKNFYLKAVSDSRGGIVINSAEGLNPELVMDCKKKNGKISGCYCVGAVCDSKIGTDITNEELLTLPVDILVPAALESVITRENMKDIKAKIIVEMANGPITEEAREYLIEKGTIIIPDVLANAGGVIVSYLEWVQGKQGYWWNIEKVMESLNSIMSDAFISVWNQAQAREVDLTTAAFEVALKRISIKV